MRWWAWDVRDSLRSTELAVVADSSDELSYVPSLEAVGYRLRVREPDFDEHRMLRTVAKDVHLHVFSSNSVEISRYLVFRDRLRTNSADRERYELAKRRLAAHNWRNWDDYAEAKSEVVEGIIHAAMVSLNGDSSSKSNGA